MASSDDDVTLGEIGRRLADLHNDLRELRSEVVRADVYAAHQAREEVRTRKIEADVAALQEARTSTARMLWGAIGVAASSFLVQLLVAAIHQKP